MLEGKIERGNLGELSNLKHIYVYDYLVEARTGLEMKAQAIYTLNQSTTQNYIRLIPVSYTQMYLEYGT